ncbi:IQ calmodulin-binding motif-containing protein 1-like [Polypterus senegalus]|uniref:IQ calmodulin-binding motif-containing protein 1-like n=1 Tax=Polypterus senegalus TaxID=55291 RepID=UPI00196437D9|nr:IQ calmodulin-binding motif-containing protein 1-like [Polypterus senegalus]XP_039611171.1 IQ calmodulin-binding motif-containing protein 1-like [Polypterus senegalus]
METNVDPRISALAAEIAESPEKNVPLLLLRLKEIVTDPSLSGKQLQKLKQDVYYYDLIQYCILVLKQDFSRIQGSWATAGHLADLLSNCCVNFEPLEETEEYYNKVLPLAVENLLLLARRLQARRTRAVKNEEKAEFIHTFRIVAASLCWLCDEFIQLTHQVLKSEHFLQLLLTDDVETGVIVMSVLQNLIRVNGKVFGELEETTEFAILDELVFKLSSTNNPVTGSTATRVLLLIVSNHPTLVTQICSRYKGLQHLLKKQWTGKGFNNDLEQLLELLYSGSFHHTEMQRLQQAASLIQAAWKAFQTRKRLKKLPNAVATIQRSFRNKKEKERLILERQKEEEELRHHLLLQRQRAIRRFHQRQLELLQIIPAELLNRHIQDQEMKAALLIQRHWRGHRERRNFHQQKQALKQYKAAVTLQRAVLRFLKKRRNAKQILSPWKGPPGLTDARRLELKKKVEEHIGLHRSPVLSAESSNELHLKAQEMLIQHWVDINLQRKADLRRDALLAQINTDLEFLTNMPSLKEATTKDIDIFTSRSVPVAARARQSHNAMLQYMRWPWWKKLGDEFLDPENIPEDNLEAEIDSLYLGGDG